MFEIIELLFSSFWHWLGGLLYLAVITQIRVFTVSANTNTRNDASSGGVIGNKGGT